MRKWLLALTMATPTGSCCQAGGHLVRAAY